MSDKAAPREASFVDGFVHIREGDHIRIEGWEDGDILVRVDAIDENGQLTVTEMAP